MPALAVSLAITLALEGSLEGELADFPPREVVAVQTQFAREHGKYLRKVRESVPLDEEMLGWHRYLTRAYWPWVQLRMAQDKTEPLEKRIEHLAKLKALLDRDIMLRGRMPPAVCFWRFREGPPLPDFPVPELPKRPAGPLHPRAN